MNTLRENALKELLLEGTLCDTVIRVGGDVELKVHKIILCSCSSYFRDLFCSKPSALQVYSFPDVSPNIMKLILEFAYTRSAVVTEGNVLELLAGADRFAITDLIQACCVLLLQKLCPNNCINIWRLAQHYQYTDLMGKALQYILHHFEEVAGVSAEFLQLSVEQLADLLEKDELNVKQESSVFEAVLQWINFAPEERRGSMALLMSKVRLLLMPTDYLVNIVSKHNLVRNNLQCVNILISNMKSLQETNMEKPLARTRLPSHYLLAIGGFEDNFPTDKIELYNIRNDSWVTVHKSEKAFPEFCSCLYLSGNIYCVGGSDGDHYLSSVQRFDLATQTWQEVGSMHVARCYVSVVVLDGCIYAMGGCDKYETHASAEQFDPDTNQWTLIAPMHEPRADAGSATLHGKVYVCGGFMMDEPLFSAEFYNLDTDQWTEITPMDTPRTATGVIAYNDQIFVIGGYNGVRHISGVSVYDPISKHWHTAAPMLHCRSNFGVEVLEGQLYVAGGFHNDNKQLCSRVERYDGKTNKWEVVEDLEAPRGAISCCAVERIPHANFLL
ncbi:kelch-like protein 10 [Kryptolebias marmoratus]|uniref:kelch-like protein 10 n=1 Tax=Kryptolebias marmoratus TaxID=37003 RepID=UPI0007F8AD94|nr:kelch-like protein 10 [Kryptolebias marmoratus]